MSKKEDDWSRICRESLERLRLNPKTGQVFRVQEKTGKLIEQPGKLGDKPAPWREIY